MNKFSKDDIVIFNGNDCIVISVDRSRGKYIIDEIDTGIRHNVNEDELIKYEGNNNEQFSSKTHEQIQ